MFRMLMLNVVTTQIVESYLLRRGNEKFTTDEVHSCVDRLYRNYTVLLPYPVRLYLTGLWKNALA